MTPLNVDDYRVRLGRRIRKATAKPRRGARRTVEGVLRQLPQYGRLLAGLATDRRVSAVDKVLVGLALAYLVLPLDFIPDAIPFLGQVDDVYLVMLALQRLVDRAGRRVLADHWTGDRAALRSLNIAAVVSAAAFFLPGQMRKRLRGLLG